MKLVFTLVVFLACIALVQGTHLVVGNDEKQPLLKVSRMKGNLEAPVRIVEFFDYECPSCAKASRSLSAYLKTYPDEILLEAKFYPLKGHAHSLRAAQYAECASRQERFWAYHHALFEKQDAWRVLPDAEGAFQELAREVDLDGNKLRACLEDPRVSKLILEDKAEGRSYGVRSTPSFLINGELFVGHNALLRKLSAHFAKRDET